MLLNQKMLLRIMHNARHNHIQALCSKLGFFLLWEHQEAIISFNEDHVAEDHERRSEALVP